MKAEIGTKGRKVVVTTNGERIRVAVSKKGRPVAPGVASAEAKKRFPGVEWEFTRRRSHDTLVTSRIMALEDIQALSHGVIK